MQVRINKYTIVRQLFFINVQRSGFCMCGKRVLEASEIKKNKNLTVYSVLHNTGTFQEKPLNVVWYVVFRSQQW